MNSRAPAFSDAWFAQISDHLRAGRMVRATLPQWGRVHIDRALPFLCVYRRPVERPDAGTSRLVLGEAAYLRAQADPARVADLQRLIAEILTIQHEAFGAFLLLEIWSGEEVAEEQQQAGFRIHVQRDEVSNAVLEELESMLLRIRPHGARPAVAVAYDDVVSAPGLPELLPDAAIEGRRVVRLGLEVTPIYRHANGKTLYPFELRHVQQGVAQALKRALHTFTHRYTTHRPAHYHELGRRAITASVWETDQQLADISATFDLLLHVSPVNTAEAWQGFQQNRFEQPPRFLYRPRPIDPGLMKRQLFAIPIEKIEDPTLAHIFLAKREELDRQITLVADRNTPRFLLESRQLYGDVDAQLAGLARTMLERIPAQERGPDIRILGPEEIARAAEEELQKYRRAAPALASRVELRDDVPGVMVSRGNFLVGRDASLASDRVAAILAHEISTHVLTHFNGSVQPFRELQMGLAGYEPMQEGLAVTSEFLVGGLQPSRLRVLAARVLAVESLVQGADFIEVFRLLHRDHGFAARTAFTIAMRVFRGGGYTKDMVYLQGLERVLQILAKRVSLEILYCGKVAVEFVPFVEELHWRKVLKKPPLLPWFVDDPDVKERLHRLHQGMSVLDLAGGGD